jgi:hypothetical protein
MKAMAVVLERPEHILFDRVELTPPGEADMVVDIAFSGVSTGTEKLLWNGRMPTFPGMGYPLVPGYESVGRVVQAGPASGFNGGETRLRARRPLLRRRSAACSAVPRPAWSSRASASCRSATARRPAPCCSRSPPPPTTRSPVEASASRSCRPTSSSATACSAGCSHGSPCSAATPRRWCGSAMRVTGPRGRRRLQRGASRGRHAPRLPRDLRRERRLPRSSTR